MVLCRSKRHSPPRPRLSASSKRARSWKTSASPTTAVCRDLARYKSSHCSINSASEAMAPSAGTADPLIIVISGPGGVGKGTIVNALVERDSNLSLSRSWTTRRQRRVEPDTAYVFTDHAGFEQRIARGGFLEWTKFLDN